MRLFHLYRNRDLTGVSGTGPVVEGVQFTNGWCAIRWLSGKSSLCFYQSIEDVRQIHSHGGETEIVVHDFEPFKRRQSPSEGKNFEILLQLIEEASHILMLAEDVRKGSGGASLKFTLSRIRALLEQLEKNVSSAFKAGA